MRSLAVLLCTLLVTVVLAPSYAREPEPGTPTRGASGTRLAEGNYRWFMVEADQMMAASGGGEKLVALCRRAAKSGYNGLLLWDSNLWDRNLPSSYAANSAALKRGIAELGFSLMIEMCPRGTSVTRWSGDSSMMEPRPRDPHPLERDYRYLCLAHPGVIPIWEEQMKRAEEIYDPVGWLLQYDELRVSGADQRCRASGKTPGQLLAEHGRQAIAMCRRVSPGRTVAIWNDMFDPHHNATAQKYYHVIGSLQGAEDAIDPDVLVMDFNDKLASFSFWLKRGNLQMIPGYFDGELGLQKEAQLIKEARKNPGLVGWMYTTWESNFKDLEFYGAMCGFGGGGAARRPE